MAFTKKFYISDTHFSHKNIIQSCKRPFADIDEMDEHMIAEWNSVVAQHDILYHLGDFAFGLNDSDRVRNIFSRLHGRKFLVLGNHDVDRDGAIHPTISGLGWEKRPEHWMSVSDGDKQKIGLGHYGQRVWHHCHYGSFHFYGHSHGKLPGVERSRDVGVDVADVWFRPRTFAELIKGME